MARQTRYEKEHGNVALHAPIVASSSGATAQVAAVTDKVICVVSYNFMANGAVNVKWQSGSTDISGLSYLIANTGKVAGFNEVGWVKTAPGEALNLNLSDAIGVGGELAYYLL